MYFLSSQEWQKADFVHVLASIVTLKCITFGGVRSSISELLVVHLCMCENMFRSTESLSHSAPGQQLFLSSMQKHKYQLLQTCGYFFLLPSTVWCCIKLCDPQMLVSDASLLLIQTPLHVLFMYSARKRVLEILFICCFSKVTENS